MKLFSVCDFHSRLEVAVSADFLHCALQLVLRELPLKYLHPIERRGIVCVWDRERETERETERERQRDTHTQTRTRTDRQIEKERDIGKRRDEGKRSET